MNFKSVPTVQILPLIAHVSCLIVHVLASLGPRGLSYFPIHNVYKPSLSIKIIISMFMDWTEFYTLSYAKRKIKWHLVCICIKGIMLCIWTWINHLGKVFNRKKCASFALEERLNLKYCHVSHNWVEMKVLLIKYMVCACEAWSRVLRCSRVKW